MANRRLRHAFHARATRCASPLRRALTLAGLVSAMGLFLAGCAIQAVDLITPRSGYTLSQDLAYGPDPRQRYDLYIPDGATGQTPLVVFIHGGSWDSGSKDIYRFLGQAFTKEGFILAVPNYRLYPEVTFPAFVKDGARALAAIDTALLRGVDGVPGGRRPLALMGHSAGAQIAALLAFDPHYLLEAGSTPRRLSAFVGLAGPYDFLPLTDPRYQRIFPPATRAASQPVRFARNGGPPALLIHGRADETVAITNTQSMGRAIEAAGGSVEVELFDKVDHIGPIASFVTAVPVGDPAIRRAVFDFLKQRS